MCSDKSKGKIVFSGNDSHYPGQTDHDACFIPVSVRQCAGAPLYIIVAHWCLLQQNWVQRNQIA
ncbi:CaiF/GrlA family transcriptional regulator, partial [Salmonella enterica]|uniref:CaiF/GrlA family transcriptional regulator n=1 Tax=Salmonella enterica TaxID=28901 RepID=UPI003EDC831C